MSTIDGRNTADQDDADRVRRFAGLMAADVRRQVEAVNAIAADLAAVQRVEPDEIRDAKHWRQLVEERATIATLTAEVEKWQTRCLGAWQVRWDVEDVLDSLLGTEDVDDSGDGLAADVALLGQQRDTARTNLANLAADMLTAEDELSTDEINQMADLMEAADAKIERVEALIATWHASPDMRTRAHADRLSEAFDGRPRA